MGSKIAAKRRYSQQRERRIPPHMSLQDVRLLLKALANKYDLPIGFDIDDICDRVEATVGDRPARGTISAIENGARGVSAELLTALEKAYGTRPGTITTAYEPRATPGLSDEVA